MSQMTCSKCAGTKNNSVTHSKKPDVCANVHHACCGMGQVFVHNSRCASIAPVCVSDMKGCRSSTAATPTPPPICKSQQNHSNTCEWSSYPARAVFIAHHTVGVTHMVMRTLLCVCKHDASWTPLKESALQHVPLTIAVLQASAHPQFQNSSQNNRHGRSCSRLISRNPPSHPRPTPATPDP